MPLYDEKKADLSMHLTVRIENLVKEFCVEKNFPHGDIPELLDHLALSRLVQNFGLKVKVEPSSKHLPDGLEFALSGSPKIII